MKYVKMLELLAVAAVALMAVVGTASATTITSSTGLTPTLHAASVGHLILHNAVGTMSCNSTLTLSVTSHGSGVTTRGQISTMSFTNCTSGTIHTDIQGMISTPGSLEFHAASTTGNATITWTGARYGTTMFGVECGYETNSTDIGEVIGGEHAVLKIKATLNRTFGSIFCGTTGNWTGEYKFTHPTDLTFH